MIQYEARLGMCFGVSQAVFAGVVGETVVVEFLVKRFHDQLGIVPPGDSGYPARFYLDRDNPFILLVDTKTGLLLKISAFKNGSMVVLKEEVYNNDILNSINPEDADYESVKVELKAHKKSLESMEAF